MNECIDEFNPRRKTVHHSRPVYWLSCAHCWQITGRQVVHWLLMENILPTCVFIIENLDSKSNAKLIGTL